jgi:hypothetical protein
MPVAQIMRIITLLTTKAIRLVCCLLLKHSSTECNRNGGLSMSRTESANCPMQIQEWLAEVSAAKMEEAGVSEDLRAGENDLGGFRRVHVNLILSEYDTTILLLRMLKCCLIA